MSINVRTWPPLCFCSWVNTASCGLPFKIVNSVKWVDKERNYPISLMQQNWVKKDLRASSKPGSRKTQTKLISFYFLKILNLGKTWPELSQSYQHQEAHWRTKKSEITVKDRKLCYWLAFCQKPMIYYCPKVKPQFMANILGSQDLILALLGEFVSCFLQYSMFTS